MIRFDDLKNASEATIQQIRDLVEGKFRSIPLTYPSLRDFIDNNENIKDKLFTLAYIDEQTICFLQSKIFVFLSSSEVVQSYGMSYAKQYKDFLFLQICEIQNPEIVQKLILNEIENFYVVGYSIVKSDTLAIGGFSFSILEFISFFRTPKIYFSFDNEQLIFEIKISARNIISLETNLLNLSKFLKFAEFYTLYLEFKTINNKIVIDFIDHRFNQIFKKVEFSIKCTN